MAEFLKMRDSDAFLATIPLPSFFRKSVSVVSRTEKCPDRVVVSAAVSKFYAGGGALVATLPSRLPTRY